MAIPFVIAVFVSAWLLFAVQPMAAKWLLPSLGGSPAVWITSMLFYQTALLLGYGYAHLVGRLRDRRVQVGVHSLLLLAGLAYLPLAFGTGAPAAGQLPSVWLVARLAAGLGLPLVALSATGPLLQRWYAAASSRDPFVLYSASNLGSLGALLSYPFLVEPWLPVHQVTDSLLPQNMAQASQNTAWSLGYLAFTALCLFCGAALLRSEAAPVGKPAAVGAAPALGWRRRALWLVLAAVPSSAMLGTTLLITTDIAAVPLLWILPLATYLSSFIVAFARPGAVPPRIAAWALALCASAIVFLRWIVYRPPPVPMIGLTLLTLFVLAYLCHDRLSRTRPEPARLTEFYLWLALGGALGGLFNAVVAPLLFDGVIEYPVALVLAMLLREPSFGKRVAPGSRKSTARGLVVDLAAVLALAAMLAGIRAAAHGAFWPAESTTVVSATVGCLLALAMAGHRLRFALSLALLFIAVRIGGEPVGRTLLEERTFFGVLRVDRTPGRPFRIVEGDDTSELQAVDSHDLFNGTTRHGRQMFGSGLDRIGASYYHPTGPIGKLFRTFRGSDRLEDVAVIGLGVGALASYGRVDQTLTFYEIDPSVSRIAEDPSLFTYLRDSKARIRVRLGDGRLLISEEPDGSFDLVVVDGFTSDAIPVHLLTLEAFEVYFRKLRADGLLALHLTNEHFDLLPVVRGIAAALAVDGLAWNDVAVSPREQIEGKSPSVWVVVSRDSHALDPVRANGAWVPLDAPPRGGPWTDSFSSPLSALRRR